MGVELRRAVLGQHHLLERARPGVGLDRQEPRHDGPVGDHVANAQGGRDRLGERPAVDHPRGIAQRPDRRRPRPLPQEVGVAVVLEDRHAEPLRQLQQLEPAGLGQHAARRVLHRRDRIDVLRPHALALKPRQDLAERVGPDALLVERRPDGVHADGGKSRQRAAIGRGLGDHGIAGREQDRVDQIERLKRAGGDQDLVGATIHARAPLERARDELAQGAVALRAALQAIGRQRPAFTLQNGIRGRGQTGDRDVVGVVVAANEVEGGKPGPALRRRRQPRTQ